MMRIVTSTSLAAALASALLATGCGGGAATQPAMAMTPAAPATEPTADMPGATHVLTADEPYYIDAPNATSVPAGVLKAGTPVLLMVPGATYCKVISNQGRSCYTLTSGLKPISDK